MPNPFSVAINIKSLVNNFVLSRSSVSQIRNLFWHLRPVRETVLFANSSHVLCFSFTRDKMLHHTDCRTFDSNGSSWTSPRKGQFMSKLSWSADNGEVTSHTHRGYNICRLVVSINCTFSVGINSFTDVFLQASH